MKIEIKPVTKYGWQLINLYDQFKDETGAEIVNLDDVYEWATAKGQYTEPPSDPAAKFKRDLSRALRSKYHIDPQHREVRTHLPVIKRAGPKAVVLWADQRTARPGHVHLYLQQDRIAIGARCKRHKGLRDSYNDNNLFNAQLPLFDYNFNADNEESEYPTEYPNERPSN